ncbi:hypothetical protein Tco_1433079 [Tanacetum coccineum]
MAPPAPTASGDSGDSIDMLFDKGNDVEQERSTERDDDVLKETIAKDVPEIVVEETKKKRKSKAVGDASGSTHPPKRLREDFHAATSDIGGKSLAAIRGLIPEDSSVSELNLWTRPLVSRSSVADVLVVTTVATTTIAADVFAIPPPQVRVVSGSPASVGGAKKNVASTSKLDEPATSSDSFYAAQYLDSETLHNIYIPKCKVTNDYVLNDPLIRLREQVSVVEVADAIKGNELRDLKEMNFSLEGEKDILSEKVTTLESVTALKETEVVSLEYKRGGLVNQISSLESTFELFKQQMEAMQDEQAIASRNRVMELDAQLLEIAAHLAEEFYPRFFITISRRRWILTHGLKLVLLKCLQSSEYYRVLGQAIGCAINKGIQDGLKAGVDHGKSRRDLFVIKAYDPFAESKYIDAVDFSLLTEL